MQKAMLKYIPATKDWERFSGEGEYDHFTFCQKIDNMRKLLNIPDAMIVSRLPTVLQGVAREWFHCKFQEAGMQDWKFWKEEINKKFSTSFWRRRMEVLFDSHKFDPAKESPMEFCLKQRNRLRAFAKHLSQSEVNQRILEKCEGDLEHAVKSRINYEEVDFETMISVIEEIVQRTNIGKPKKNFNSWKQTDGNAETSKPGSKTKETSFAKKNLSTPGNTGIKCHKCGKIGHVAKDCRVKGVNLIDCNSGEEDDNQSESSDSEPQEKEGERYNIDNIHTMFDAVAASTNEVNNMVVTLSLEEGMDIAQIRADSSLPERWDPTKPVGRTVDARPVKPTPDRGRGFTAGESRFVTVLFKRKPVRLLIDSGADCSIVSEQLLNDLYPDWEDHRLPINGVKFKSATSGLGAIGIIETDITFPDLKESVRIKP